MGRTLLLNRMEICIVIAPRDRQIICSRPFKWFEVSQQNERGDVFLCCPAWLDMPIGNLQYQSVEQVWNGEKAQQIRRSILNGSFKYCDRSRCPFLQTQSGPVQKVHEIQDTDLQDVVERKAAILPYGPREINCSYDRSCNPSCPSCRSQPIMELEHRESILTIQKKIEDEALVSAYFMHITGSGDPFGSPFFREWLRTMKTETMPNFGEIRLQTNAQLWTRNMWGTIPRKVQELVKSADISIDAATPETYAINRRGGSLQGYWRTLRSFVICV